MRCMSPSMLIAADTSPLVAFSGIDRMDILKALFPRVIIAREVADEIASDGMRWLQADAVRKEIESAGWLGVEHEDFPMIAYPYSKLSKADVATVSLAKHRGVSLLMDDRRGRDFAAKNQVQVFGSLGVLLRACQSGILPAIKPLISGMEMNGIRFAPNIIQEILAHAGES
jgi:uncharacterized protein